VDDVLGRILHTLEETGASENTLVIFTSAFADMQDIACYDRQKHLFLTKPGTFPGYIDAMKKIEEYRKSKSDG
jgi:arylsulfatase A-like enzyme